jgi:hypothetical protein
MSMWMVLALLGFTFHGLAHLLFASSVGIELLRHPRARRFYAAHH